MKWFLSTLVRWILSITLLYLVFGETGIWTTVSIGLIVIDKELSLLRNWMNRLTSEIENIQTVLEKVK